MLKKIRNIVESLSSQRTVCEVNSSELASRSNDVFQQSPYPTPVAPASGGQAVSTGFKPRRRQEPEGAPYLTTPVSVENEGSPTLLQEV